MAQRRIFRDRQGRFTKPDRRKVFRIEIDGDVGEFQRWTARQLDEALAIPLPPEPLGPVAVGGTASQTYEIQSAFDLVDIVAIAPEGAQGAQITVTFPDGSQATSFKLFGEPGELFGRQWELFNELNLSGSDELNAILSQGPIRIEVVYTG